LLLLKQKPFKPFGLKGCTQFLGPYCYTYPLFTAELMQAAEAGLLAPPPYWQPSHFDRSKQWHSVAKRVLFFLLKERGYSGGTAPDLNGIPY
jgi:hypothetical protein